MTSYQLQAPEAPSSLTARDVFQLLWRRSGVVLLCLGATAGLTYFISIKTPKAWNATAQMIMVDHPAGGVGSPSASALNPPIETVDTQITMLQSPAMIERTMNRLKELKKQDSQERDYYPVTFNGQKQIRLRKLLDSDTLSNNLNVWNPRNTNLIEVAVEVAPAAGTERYILEATPKLRKPHWNLNPSRYQDTAEAWAEAVAQAFVQWKQEIVEANYDLAVSSLRTKAKVSAENFRMWQEDHVAFKQKHGMWDVAVQQGAALHGYLDANEQIKTTANDLKALQAKANLLKSEIAEIETELKDGVPVPNDLQILQDQQTITALQVKREEMAQLYTKAVLGHLNDLDEQIVSAKERLKQDRTASLGYKHPSPQRKGELLIALQSLNEEITDRQTRLNSLQTLLKDRRTALDQANKIASDYDVLTEKGKDIRSVDEALQTARNSITILQNEAVGNIMISQHAYSPDDYSRPNWLRNWLFGSVVGILLSFMAVALLEQNDQRLRTMNQTRALMPGPIIGTLPRLRTSAMSALLQGDSIDYEAYSLARANLGLALRSTGHDESEGGQIVLVTSSVPGEGKTVTAVSLARSAARAGKRTILVNADLRHPTLNDVFNTAEPHGLVDVMSGAMSLDEALVRSDTPYLDILHSGTPDRNPSDLVSQPEMADMMQDLRAEADLILIDTPPCSAVADALILAPFADCILQVVSMGMADQQVITDTTTALRTAEPKSMVFFINRAPSERPKRYGQYYYHQNGKNGHSGSNGSTPQGTSEAQPMALPDGEHEELVDQKRRDDPTV